MLKYALRYPANSTPPDGNYNLGSAKNSTAPGAKNGSPFEKDYINDILGFQQAMLAEAGITPSGLPDTELVSQQLQAIKTIPATLSINAPFIFLTEAAFKASLIEFPDGKIITLLDRKATFTKISGTGTANGFSIIASTGVNQSISLITFAGTVTLSQLGALISIDNSAVIQFAYDTYEEIIHDALYPCSGVIMTKDDTKLSVLGTNSGLINNDILKTMLGINADNIKTNSMIFDGNSDKAHTDGLVRLFQERVGFESTDDTFQNIVGDATNNPVGVKQYGLIIDTFGCTDFKVVRPTFKNIIGFDQDDVQAGVGFAGGIYITSDFSSKDETTNTKPSSGVIDTPRFFDIYTDGIDGDISHSDAEGIRVFQTITTPPNFVRFDIEIITPICKRVQKSGIKTSGAGGFKISNPVVISDNSNDPDASGLPMLAALRLQEGSDSVVTNLVISGDFVHAAVLSCAGTSIDGIFQESGEIQNSVCFIFATNTAAADIHDIAISKLRLKKANVIVNTSLPSATSNFLFKNISVSDVKCEEIGTFDGTNFRINNVDGFEANDINIKDPSFNTEVCWSFRDSNVVKMKAIYGETTDIAIDENETTTTIRAQDYKLNNIEFFASLGRRTKTTRLINLRNSGNSSRNEIEKLEIVGLTISTPMMDSTGNHDILLIETPNLKLDNFTTTVRNEGGTNRPNSGAKILNTKQGSMITDVSIIELGSPTGTKFVVELDGGDKTQIRGITGADRGVNEVSGNNINIADVTTTGTPVVSTGTNVTQDNIVQWV